VATQTAVRPAPHPTPGTAALRTARLVTELLAPGLLLMAVTLAVGWHSTRGFTGLVWGVATAFVCTGIPYAFVIWGVRQGHWTDHHITVRSQRKVPLLVTLGCVTVWITLLVLIPDAPREVLALVVSMLGGLAVTLAVTKWWKVSVHTAVVSGVVTIMILTYGVYMTAAVSVVVLTAWSRVVLRDHTPAQTVGGALLGMVAATGFSVILR
jgi:membrane-associated phospholipid phosphatase